MEPFISKGADEANPSTHVIITVRGRDFSVVKGTEQHTADEIAANMDGVG